MNMRQKSTRRILQRAAPVTTTRVAFGIFRAVLLGVCAIGLMERASFAAGADPLQEFGIQVITVLLRLVGILAVAGGLIVVARLITGASVGGSRQAGEAILSAAAIIAGVAFALFAPQIIQNVIDSLGAGFTLPTMPTPN